VGADDGRADGLDIVGFVLGFADILVLASRMRACLMVAQTLVM